MSSNSGSGGQGELESGEVAGAGAVQGVAVPPGVQAEQVEGDGGVDVFEVGLVQAAVAGVAHAGDGDGLVDGGLDPGAQRVLGLPVLGVLLGAGVVEGLVDLAGPQGELAAAAAGGGALVTGRAGVADLGGDFTTTAWVPRWAAGLHDALACPCGQVTRWVSQSTVKAARSNPAPARACGEVSSSTGVTSAMPKSRLEDTTSSADG